MSFFMSMLSDNIYPTSEARNGRSLSCNMPFLIPVDISTCYECTITAFPVQTSISTDLVVLVKLVASLYHGLKTPKIESSVQPFPPEQTTITPVIADTPGFTDYIAQSCRKIAKHEKRPDECAPTGLSTDK